MRSVLSLATPLASPAVVRNTCWMYPACMSAAAPVSRNCSSANVYDKRLHGACASWLPLELGVFRHRRFLGGAELASVGLDVSSAWVF